MCGIFGMVANSKSRLSGDVFKTAIPKLIKLSERRGREAAGLAIAVGDTISIYKEAMKPSTMVKSPRFIDFLNSCLSVTTSIASGSNMMSFSFIGHTRLVTNGSQAISENNQPIKAGHAICVHNGIITNDKQLLGLYPELKQPHDYSSSDTKVFTELINRYYSEAGDIVKAIRNSYKQIKGSASIALLCDDLSALVLATNTGSLYYTYNEERGLFVFASERYIVEKFLEKSGLGRRMDFKKMEQVAASSGIVVSFDDVIPQAFLLNASTGEEKRSYSNNRIKKIYKIVDAAHSPKELRRCSRCVLPETYPFIIFDSDNVCNYCKNYQRQNFEGRKALEAILEKYRSKNSEPDCIVGFSGGRDSSYGLHILKNELGMHPIAYTYDWAMVTDLARRNQAKMVGKLGVEHIIRAADIHTKRRYIRKNIYAWLKRPNLGMVPLFMAGDKMFYYYGRRLRKETGIKLTVFAAGHQLEQMEFKVGFCGVDQTLVNNTKLYNFDPIKKVQLALWYIKQYLINPSYLNESLIDSIFAYYSSFINKDDYLYLYRYIPWDEKLIEKTLHDTYGWEMDEQYGKNQWRMGDGYTAFIDYIYYTMAGFSEFDNFRSNQIREGLITREGALELLKDDNRPRIDMLQEFSQLIGFNLEEVLLKINSCKKLY